MGEAVVRAAARRAAAVASGGVKGDGGLVIVIGGSRAYSAPPFLAGLAARRTGVHGVRIAAPAGPASQQTVLEAHLLEASGPELNAATVRAVAETSAQATERLQADGARGRVVWLVGPGLGGSPQARQVLDALIEARRQDRSAALVVDGSLGGGVTARRRIQALGADVVLLNLHEARALLPTTRQPGRGETIDPLALAALAREVGAVVVAKGDPDRITDGARTLEVPVGHPWLARHGTGDVLAGVAAGLLAQALPALDAAALACHLVGTAGIVLAADIGPGWFSRDLLDTVGAVLRDLLIPGSRGTAPTDQP
ncbi:ADP-dependent NAD(P)H-hydrate dehydratase [Actinoalloteichus fjordicus]|uniref:ADP-dependent (S)-NAD(P)H-hydrate dehydratase n=1 Tax=Actinoalloteichus fjordicus TaxID=1612552 RepID=A0AAC9LFD1_9PSEU|nr:NAD(P)H-hydrate dehydratase [Actinoalloteichus fjordicus]APU15209.1 putative sugar kinase [Actinoalloteichus fjordicus]